VPLLLFGGTVTGIEAGMAIDGWLVLEPGRGDHFLLFYPVEKWFRDDGTFAEHTHRLFGALVGLLAIATFVATLLADPRRRARILTGAALLAVCAQGALGGLRVLENSPSLAFLHGALAQLVFCVLAASVVYLSPRWPVGAHKPWPQATELKRSALTALCVVYGTIFAGAWLRHAVSNTALAVHIALVLVSTVLCFFLAKKLKASARHDDQNPAGRRMQEAIALRLNILLGSQLLLGSGSFWIVFLVVGSAVPEIHQSILPTLHVLFGALLLAQLVSTAMWAQVSGRVAPAEEGALLQANPGGVS
jgi:heme a synthase